MPSSATTLLKLEDMATGEKSTTWGDVADVVIAGLEQAAKHAYPYSCAATGNITLTDTDYIANDVRRASIRLTGSRSANGNIILPARELEWDIINETTGGYTLTVKTSGGTGVDLLPSGGWYSIYGDGTNILDKGFRNGTQVTAALGALSSAGFYTTSTTSNAISVAGTNLTFTTADSGKAFTAGTPVRIASTSNPATNYMDAIVTSYSGTTLNVTVTDATGSGTIANWTISVAGGPSVTQATIVRSAKTTAYVVTPTDNGALIDCTSGTFTVTLPVAATAGAGFNVRVINTGSGVITVDGDGSETINGDLAHTLLQFQYVHLYCTGSAWLIMADSRKKKIQAKTAGYEVVASDIGTVIAVSTTAIVSAAACSSLGTGFIVEVQNSGTGIVTFDPNSSEVVKDNASVTQTAIYLHRGQSVELLCDASSWWITKDGRSPLETWAFPLASQSSALSTGTAVVTFQFPHYGFEIVDTPIVTVMSASTSGLVSVDVNDDGTSIFATNKISVDANEKSSVDAAAQATLSTVPLRIAKGSIVTVDVDSSGTAAKGPVLYLWGRRTP